jgi:hypothetical protein
LNQILKLRGKLQAKQDLALKQGNDYYDYITGEVKSNANAAPIEFGIAMIKSEVRSLLILNLVITPSLISERPLTIVSFEVLIKEHLSQ